MCLFLQDITNSDTKVLKQQMANNKRKRVDMREVIPCNSCHYDIIHLRTKGVVRTAADLLKIKKQNVCVPLIFLLPYFKDAELRWKRKKWSSSHLICQAWDNFAPNTIWFRKLVFLLQLHINEKLCQQIFPIFPREKRWPHIENRSLSSLVC